MKKHLLLIVCGLALFACNSKQKEVNDDIITIKIVHINDVYEIDAINNGQFGGLARVVTIRDSIKAQFPNTFYFHAGDIVNPSLLGTIKVDGERLNGKQMIEVLNANGLDLATFGNHEFDLKEGDLQNRLNESNFAWTSANVRHVTPNGNMPFRIENSERNQDVSDYELFTVLSPKGDTLKFGVFGVTIPSNPKDYVYYGDIFDEAIRAYDEASKQANFVLALTHLSLKQDRELAERIPSLPLIMGGHEHYNMFYEVGKTFLAKADANVASLYVHTLTYNMTTQELKVESELVIVDESYPANSEVQQIVDKWNLLLDENLKTIIDNPDEVIFHATIPLDGTDDACRSEQTNLGELINRSMFAALDPNLKVEGVISNGGGIRIDDQLKGDITSKDIFRILPFGGHVLVVEMTGELLKQVLDFGVEASGTGAYLQRLYVKQNEERNWVIGEREVANGETYSIALNDFLMLGLDIPFLNYDNPGVKKVIKPVESDLANDLRKCVIHYLKSGNN